MRYFSLIFLLLLGGCSLFEPDPAPKPVLEEIIKEEIKTQKKHTTKVDIAKPKFTKITDFSWTGYYHANIPHNGKIVKTILKLVAKEGKMGYFLFENDGEVKESRGLLIFLDNSTIRLKNGRLLFKGEDFVAFIDDINQGPDSKKILEKLQVFLDNERRLLVDSTSVTKGTVNQSKAVQFEGILNVKNKDQYKSLKAVYILNCSEKSYALSKTTYYQDKFATGKVVDIVKNSEGEFFTFDYEDDVLYHAYKKYCKED